MNIKRMVGSILAAATLAAVTQAGAPAPTLALKGLDPVALVEGREVTGREDLQLTHGLYHYRFASAENRARFLTDRERFAIQLGGACGRMGPLSGLGSPERFLVQDGKTYIFASDSCRASFAKTPERFLEGDDAPPAGTPEARERGAQLIARAAQAAGAAELAKLSGVAVEMSITYGEGEKAQTGRRRVVLGFPDEYHLEESWGEWAGGEVLSGETSRRASGGEEWAGDVSVHRALVRARYREPLALLAVRTQPEFVAVALEPAELDGRAVERVAVAYGGATSTLFIAADSAHILAVEYRGRGATGMGTLRLSYADFRPVSGLILPWAFTSSFEGVAVAEPKVAIKNIEVRRKS